MVYNPPPPPDTSHRAHPLLIRRVAFQLPNYPAQTVMHPPPSLPASSSQREPRISGAMVWSDPVVDLIDFHPGVRLFSIPPCQYVCATVCARLQHLRLDVFDSRRRHCGNRVQLRFMIIDSGFQSVP
ncbi:hypothetical protein EX30DRAFT_343515 [Ascodesmis nigricans]|uniref:Uncharacterized protein n=1 Tax=Ascodesmis nigricans TaxID=341454 RepID=A0A4S2MRW7_9PEZI|nr:hypothetical protein EX30DRAFT_343515 [Ascodesmis nigricans]